LREAILCRADLTDSDLQNTNMRYADLLGARLNGTDLRGADLDYATLPLWCGTFAMKVDSKFIYQLVCHLTRFDQEGLSEEAKTIIKLLDPWKNRFCDYHDDVNPI